MELILKSQNYNYETVKRKQKKKIFITWVWQKFLR